MAKTTQGWHTVIKPSEQVTGINAMHYNAKGVVHVWQRAGGGYRLTPITPDGAVRVGLGRTKKAAYASVS